MINLYNSINKFSKQRTITRRMISIVEERREEQQRSEFEVEEVPLRIWEQVTNQIRQEIVSLQNQLWQSNIDKVFKRVMEMMKMGKSNRQCSICCNSFEKDETIIQLPCKHIFHKSCLFSWLDHSTKCPNCRSDVLDLLMSQER